MGLQVQYYTEKIAKKRVFYTGADDLLAGYALCYDRNYGTAADLEKRRRVDVEKPASGNLNHFAGVVHQKSSGVTGGQWIDLIQPTGGVIELYTDVNCTQESTRLCPQAGSYAFGRVGLGPIVGLALQTVDRSSTNGRVQSVLNPADPMRQAQRSNLLWESCPWREAREDPSIGYGYYSDFHTWDDTDDWVVTNATAGTAAIIDGAGGLLELDSASSTADQGVQVQLANEGFIPAANKDIWYEARLKISDLPSGCQFFAGLAVLDTTVMASGENSTANHIGFEMNATSQAADAGVAYFEGEKAGTRTEVTDVHTFVDDTFVNLGFHVLGVTTITPYVNGVAGTTIPTAGIPIVEMTPTFVCQEEGGSVDPVCIVDDLRVFQLR